jgi:hypothetical protein
VLCLDLVRDTACKNLVRLIKLCDIAQLLKAERNMDWNRLLNRARDTGAIRSLFFGFRVLGPVFDISTLALAALDEKEPSNVLDASLRKVRDCRMPAAIRNSAHEALLIASLHDRASAKILTTLLHPILVPTTADIQCILLPRFLHFIYYIIRPIRLAIKYSRAAIGHFTTSSTYTGSR